jgi:hypothetical protein
MARKQLATGFVLGMMTGLVAVFVLSGGRELPKAMAQARPPIGTIDQLPPSRELPRREPGRPPEPVPTVGRYQVSAWAYPATEALRTYYSASHGAYVVDTQTGQVWGIKEDGKPVSLGGVK